MRRLKARRSKGSGSKLAGVKVPSSARAVVYRCKRCGGAIAATAADPVCYPTGGTYHFGCMLAEGAERSARESVVEAERTERRREHGRRVMAQRRGGNGQATLDFDDDDG